MVIKIERPHALAFLCGLLSHVLIWFLVFVSDPSRLCVESECWSLIILDLPVSLLYSTTNYAVTYGSLFFGSAWWGFLWALSYSLFRQGDFLSGLVWQR
jgi:hypothetical protein